MVARKSKILILSLIVVITVLVLILVRGITSQSTNREAVNMSPRRIKNLEENQSAAAQKLAELHKHLNLEERENWKLEIMSFMYMLVVKAGAYEEGIIELRSLLEEYPNNELICSRARDYIVRFHIENGNYQEAMEQAKILIDKYPSSNEALFTKMNIGLCYEKLSQWEKAKETYRSLFDEPYKRKSTVGKSVRHGLFYFRLGRCLFNQGRHQKAISQFEQAFKTMEGIKLRIGEGIEDWPSVRISPMLYDDFAEALYLTGRGYQKLGENEDAKNAYQEIIEMYPESKEWVAKARERLGTMK